MPTQRPSIPQIAVIGHGHWGRNLARNVDAAGALAAIVDPAAASRSSAEERYPDARILESASTVLEDPSIDAVVIATPAGTHGAIVSDALATGKHVFVEKPLCLELAEAEVLKAAADEAGIVLMVGHLLLYHPAYRALKSVVAAGRLGKLQYIYSNRASLGKIRRTENALWSFAPHDISMILDLVGRLPAQVVCNGGQYLSDGVADTTLSHLTFDSDLQAHIFVSWLHPYKDQRLVVVGEEAMAVFNDVAPPNERLLLYPHKARWDGDLPVVHKADPEPIPFDAGEPLRAEVDAFIAAISEGVAPPSDAAEGIRVLTVLDACERALFDGQPVVITEPSGVAG